MAQPVRHYSRRHLLLATAAAPLTTTVTAGCAGPGPEYDAALADTWRDTITDSVQNRDQLEREIVRFATLSPSHRNRQPWRFELGPGWISIQPDPERRLPVADPDDHYLQVSLGAAVETMGVAATTGGLAVSVVADAAGARARFGIGAPMAPQLYAAIIQRQTARVAYDPAPLPVALLDTVVAAAGVADAPAVLVTDRGQIDRVGELTRLGAERQLRDPAWVAELKGWVRYGAGEALARRDGFYPPADGYPAVPRWLGDRFFELVTTPSRERSRYGEQFRGTAALLVIGSPKDDPEGWRAAGRGYQRAALTATAAGVRSAPANAALDYEDLRGQLGAVVGLGAARPSVVLRLGRGGPAVPRSLRRPAADVTSGQG